jgi:AhpD family alkylhydroperoxidase
MKLDNRIKELIAVGSSVAANCQPCLEYHVSKAIQLGSDEIDISEAIEVGKLVRKGAAAKMDKFALSINKAADPVFNKEDKEYGCNG